MSAPSNKLKGLVVSTNLATPTDFHFAPEFSCEKEAILADASAIIPRVKGLKIGSKETVRGGEGVWAITRSLSTLYLCLTTPRYPKERAFEILNSLRLTHQSHLAPGKMAAFRKEIEALVLRNLKTDKSDPESQSAPISKPEPKRVFKKHPREEDESSKNESEERNIHYGARDSESEAKEDEDEDDDDENRDEKSESLLDEEQGGINDIHQNTLDMTEKARAFEKRSRRKRKKSFIRKYWMYIAIGVVSIALAVILIILFAL